MLSFTAELLTENAIWQMTTAISIEDVRREVKILKALSGHKNLVQFHEAFEDAQNVYIVMEYVYPNILVFSCFQFIEVVIHFIVPTKGLFLVVCINFCQVFNRD